MLGHLLRMKREKRKDKGNKEDEIYKLALELEPPTAKGIKRAARNSPIQGKSRATIKNRLSEAVVREQQTKPVEMLVPETHTGEGAAEEPSTPAPRRLRTYSKTSPEAFIGSSAPSGHASIAAPLVMSPERLHPLLEAAEAQLKAPPVAKAAAKKQRTLDAPAVPLKIGSEFVGGWQVQTVARKTGNRYKVWWSPQGKMYPAVATSRAPSDTHTHTHIYIYIYTHIYIYTLYTYTCIYVYTSYIMYIHSIQPISPLSTQLLRMIGYRTKGGAVAAGFVSQ